MYPSLASSSIKLIFTSLEFIPKMILFLNATDLRTSSKHDRTQMETKRSIILLFSQHNVPNGKCVCGVKWENNNKARSHSKWIIFSFYNSDWKREPAFLLSQLRIFETRRAFLLLFFSLSCWFWWCRESFWCRMFLNYSCIFWCFDVLYLICFKVLLRVKNNGISRYKFIKCKRSARKCFSWIPFVGILFNLLDI